MDISRVILGGKGELDSFFLKCLINLLFSYTNG